MGASVSVSGSSWTLDAAAVMWKYAMEEGENTPVLE